MSKWTWSYAYWGGVWLLLGFLIPELLGEFRKAPWVTLSETVWHVDRAAPIFATLLFATMLALLAHFFYHERSLVSSLLFGLVVAVSAHLLDKHLP